MANQRWLAPFVGAVRGSLARTACRETDSYGRGIEGHRFGPPPVGSGPSRRRSRTAPITERAKANLVGLNPNNASLDRVAPG